MRGGLSITSGPQTLLDLSTALAPDELVAVGDALYRLGHLDHDSVHERLRRAEGCARNRRARRGGTAAHPARGVPPREPVPVLADGERPPDPGPQLPVLDRWSREVAHVDLGYDEWKVARRVRGAPARRDQAVRPGPRAVLAMAAGGWLLLRLGRADLTARRSSSGGRGTTQPRGALVIEC